jgi:hypothetical protein
MVRSKGGLQKNVRSIFQDANIDDVHIESAFSESDMVPEPASVTAAREMVNPDVSPIQSMCESAPDMPVADIPPELSPPADRSNFSDSMIEGRMKKQKCEKDFSCYKSGLEELCQARLIRRGKVVQCMEPTKTSCAYRMTTFFKRICQCSIRIHIAKKHGK